MNVYLKNFILLNQEQEEKVRDFERRTCFNIFYPLGIFPDKDFKQIEFEPVTIFYGGNGSGKSTLLNIIATRLNLLRSVPFEPGQFFDWYVNATSFNNLWSDDWNCIPIESRILTSEDVFDKTLNLRKRNHDINNHRDALTQEWQASKNTNYGNITTIHGSEYDTWKRRYTLKKTSNSNIVKKEVGFNIKTGSNGENAFKFFLEQMKADTLYLLDEPENSLSAQWQTELAQYIEGMARFERCQFVIATHSPFLLGIRGAKIYDLDTPGVPVRPWTELENVREYYSFFKSRESEF